MSTQKAKPVVAEKCTPEELLILMIGAAGGTAPGIYAYEVYAKLDPKGHSAASFRHTFSDLAVKAKQLIANNPDVELLDGVVGATPKKPVGRKRKAVEEGEGGEGGEDGAGSASGGKKVKIGGKGKGGEDGGEGAEGGEGGAADGGAKIVKIAAKAKGGVKKGGKKVVMDEEVTTEELVEEEGLGIGEMVFSQSQM